jgi:hypothetical protein
LKKIDSIDSSSNLKNFSNSEKLKAENCSIMSGSQNLSSDIALLQKRKYPFTEDVFSMDNSKSNFNLEIKENASKHFVQKFAHSLNSENVSSDCLMDLSGKFDDKRVEQKSRDYSFQSFKLKRKFS